MTRVVPSYEMEQRFQQSVGEWGDKKFPHSTLTTVHSHLCEEVNEIGTAISTGTLADLEEEAADAYLLLLQLAHRGGFSLRKAAARKYAEIYDAEFVFDPVAGHAKRVK